MARIGIGKSNPTVKIDIQNTNVSDSVSIFGRELKNSNLAASSALATRAVSTWSSQVNATDEGWWSVCWSPELGLFCAVGGAGTGNLTRIMTSPDGKNWTSRVSPFAIDYRSVCWSSDLGIFCAVASNGGTSQVATSSDGISWTSRSSAVGLSWWSVCWSPELGLFCAVARSGTGSRVMTSGDGITWVSQTSATDNPWNSVCWSSELGMFCAVANGGGASDRVMTSTNGVNWVSQTSVVAGMGEWESVCWSPELGIFCSLNMQTTAMISSDGVTWTAYTKPYSNHRSTCWSPELGLFCSVSAFPSPTGCVTSPDGKNWTSRAGAADVFWRSVCWSPQLGIFCAVSISGTGNRVMTSKDVGIYAPRPSIRKNGTSIVRNLTDVTIQTPKTDDIARFNGIFSGGTISSPINRMEEISRNSFSTSLTPSSGTLTIDTSLSTFVLGTLSASATTIAFTNVPSGYGKVANVTLILDGVAGRQYPSACTVNGTAVTNGISWINNSPPTESDNYDILSFTIVRDNAGTVNVFGSAQTNFS